MQRPISDHIRSNVWAIAACFIAAMGAAVVANASDSGPEASKSVADPAKQVRKLKQKLASVEQRLAALEGKAAPTTLPPTGPAGGDLTGTYPSPLVGPNAVGAAEIINDSVATAELASSVGVDTLGAATVTTNDLNVAADVFLFGGESVIDIDEIGNPGNPAANQVRVYARDSGGLTQLVARFADGNIDVLAEEAP